MIARCPDCGRAVGIFLRSGGDLKCESCRDRDPSVSQMGVSQAVPASSCREGTGASIAVLPGGTLESATSSSGAPHGASSAGRPVPDVPSLARRVAPRKLLPGGRSGRVPTAPLSDPDPSFSIEDHPSLPASRPFQLFRRIP